MTKIGEGKELPEKSPLEIAHRDVEYNTSRFINALESYIDADAEEKARLKTVMDNAMQLIQRAVSEIRRSDIYNQEEKVRIDYKAFNQSPTPENISALEEDLQYLRDSNRLK